MVKTNAVRMVEKAGVPFEELTYDVKDGLISGMDVARKMGQNPAAVFKTLVCSGAKTPLVFAIPVEKELDLKMAAAAAGEKRVSMLPLKELLPTTGYVHGGCSPVGMKKAFPTFIDSSACNLPFIIVSAGKIGFQLKLRPEELASLIGAQFVSLCRL